MLPFDSDDCSSDGHSTSRTRKQVAETGSFGKSTRRSRSKSAKTEKLEDPTLVAADAVFSKFLSKPSPAPLEGQQRNGGLASSASQPNLASQATALTPIDGSASSSRQYIHQVPTEVILRGFGTTQTWAAISQYENLAGLICEGYPRDPPLEQRRHKADLRDPSTLRRRALTAEENAKANRFAGGDNWIKVTFESAEAAANAIANSPQLIHGHQVYAEPYQGAPPTNQDEILANGTDPFQKRLSSQTLGRSSAAFSPRSDRRPSSTLPRSFTTPSMSQIGRGMAQSLSPPGSNSSSNTLDTNTISTATADTATVTSQSPSTGGRLQIPSQNPDKNGEFCRRIPTARRLALLPAEDALLPQQSWGRRVITNIPWLSGFSADIIGVQVPRTEQGEFDWAGASLWWRAWWLMDYWLGLSGGDIAGGAEKED
jgi:hypothetical protein